MRHPDKSRIYTLIKNDRLGDLTAQDWEIIVVSIIAETTGRTFRSAMRPIPTWVQYTPDLDVAHLFSWNCVAQTPLEKAEEHFPSLPGTIKNKIAEAIRNMIKHSPDLREGQLGYEQKMITLASCRLLLAVCS